MFDSILLSIIMKMIQNCGAYQLLLASSCCTRGVANVVVDKEWKGNSRNAQDHEIIAKNSCWKLARCSNEISMEIFG